MTKTEAIAIITSQLAGLDEERVLTVADIVQSMSSTDDLTRDLTTDELAQLEHSREDFATGRTYSLAEARALTDASLAVLGVPKSAT